MQVELPEDLIERVHRHKASGQGATDADVIRKALDSLDWHDQECLAVQEGIAAWQAGEVQTLEDFDREFRAKNNIPPDA